MSVSIGRREGEREGTREGDREKLIDDRLIDYESGKFTLFLFTGGSV